MIVVALPALGMKPAVRPEMPELPPLLLMLYGEATVPLPVMVTLVPAVIVEAMFVA